MGGNLLAILATVGILKRVVFEFAPGVRRGLNGYQTPISFLRSLVMTCVESNCRLVTRVGGCLVLLGLLVFGTNRVVADVSAVGWTFGGGSASGDYTMGYSFTPSADIWVTQLGQYDANGDGLQSNHPVALWRATDQSLLASATVPAGEAAPLAGEFRWATLATSVPLQTGQTYVVASQHFGLGDPYLYDPGGFFTAPEITFVEKRYASSTTLVYPDVSYADGVGYWGGSFQYVIPEPTSLTLLGVGLLGLLGLRRRK